MKVSLILMAVVLSLSLTGCDDQTDAKIVLPSICEYFPDSVLYSFDKRVLWIQTKVDGIGAKMAYKIYSESCQEAVEKAQNYVPLKKVRFTIVEEMNFDQRSYLVIGFKRGIVAWSVRDGMEANGVPRCQVLDWPHANEWLREHLGYVPTPDQISVVTLRDAKETPKGQPMQCQTLAQIQQAMRQQQQLQIQDLVRKEELLKNP